MSDQERVYCSRLEAGDCDDTDRCRAYGCRWKAQEPSAASRVLLTTCSSCGTRLNWREKHDGKCGECNGNTGAPPYPTFCMHPKRCAGLGSCPRDYSCIE